jgi:hypothetical protein
MKMATREKLTMALKIVLVQHFKFVADLQHYTPLRFPKAL